MVTTTKLTEPATGRLTARAEGSLKVFHHPIHLRTEEGLQFIDLTEEIVALVARSGVRNGWVNVQTLHTTTAVIVNEHEPLLLEDLKRMLARLAPQDDDYRQYDAGRTPERAFALPVAAAKLFGDSEHLQRRDSIGALAAHLPHRAGSCA